MNMILNETSWAHDAIATRTLGKKPFETLTRIARYYLDNKYTVAATRKLLDTFLLQCDASISLPKYSAVADAALDFASKHDAVNIGYIPVSSSELKSIAAIEGRQLRRLAFTLLCLAKYWDVVNKTDTHWVNNKQSEIMKLANISTSLKRQSIMYRQLKELGFVDFSRRIDNTNTRVCFIGGDDTAMRIADMRNIGYQYLAYCGEPYFECRNCGITTKRNNPGKGRPQIYCNECAHEIQIKQAINSVMRLRAEGRKSPASKRADAIWSEL